VVPPNRLCSMIAFLGLNVAFALSVPPNAYAQGSSFATQNPTVISGAGKTLGINLPVENNGTAAVANLNVTAVELSKATLLAPTVLPVLFGNIAGGASFTVRATFNVRNLTVGTKYLLTVRGTYSASNQTFGFAVNRYITIPPPPTIVIGVNTTDQLLEQARSPNGDVVDYFGQKDSNGFAQSLQTIHVTRPGLGVFRYSLDSQGRPGVVETADGTSFELTWFTNTKVFLKAISADGSHHVAVALDISTLKSGQAPASTGLKIPTIQFGSRVMRYGNPTSTLMCPGTKYSTPIPLLAASAGSCTANMTCVQVIQCGPADNANVSVTVSDNLSLASLPASLIAPGTGVYGALMPTPGAVAHNVGAVCDSVASVIGHVCDVADTFPFICLGLAAIPAAVEFVLPCLKASESIIVACEINGGGLPPGAPGLVDGFCSVVEGGIDLASGSTLTITPIAEISGVGTLAGSTVTTPTGGPYPNLSISFPNEIRILSFTTDPVNPPATVGYVATASISCAPPNTQVFLSIIGTDGFTESTSCTIQGNSSCSMFVPGALTAGIVDTLTAQVIGGPTATAVNVFQ
jgi:hypothetical protein